MHFLSTYKRKNIQVQKTSPRKNKLGKESSRKHKFRKKIRFQKKQVRKEENFKKTIRPRKTSLKKKVEKKQNEKNSSLKKTSPKFFSSNENSRQK